MKVSALHRVDLSGELEEASGVTYAGPVEHLFDLTRRLDLQIQRELSARPAKASSDALGFVAVAESEVRELLRDGPTVANEASGELQRQFQALESLIRGRVAATESLGNSLPLLQLARTFSLSDLEQDVLVACVAAEIDRRYERIFGYLQDDMGRRRPTVGLMLSICGADRDRVSGFTQLRPNGRLFSSQLVHLSDETIATDPFPGRALRADERIVGYLTGDTSLDLRIAGLVSSTSPVVGVSLGTAEQERLQALLAWLKSAGSPATVSAPIFYLYGRGSVGKARFAEELFRDLGLASLFVDVEQLVASPCGLKQALFLTLREGLLQRAAVVLDRFDALLETDKAGTHLAAVRECLSALPRPALCLAGERPWSWPLKLATSQFLPIELPRSGYEEQSAVWQTAISGKVELTDRELCWLASLYPLSPPRAALAVEIGQAAAAIGGDKPTFRQVLRGCREQSQPNFGRMARKIEAVYGWDDLVVPEATRQPLRDICLQAQYRLRVYGEWGFGRKLAGGHGLNVLFAGPSGTGKTMSAQVIANELGLDLYAIDLSQIVSKYIGETEKNLHQIFAAAQAGNAILLFDEADALLGKRSEVKDAHDRYANIEVAYLLQKMEEYEGVTVLTTNLRQNVDDAFARRIRFIVEFPFPEESDRLRIWQSVWPKQTPLGEDVDLEHLARQYRLTGGNIRNVALSAAFLAAEEGVPVMMRHLLLTTKRELLKLGRLVDSAELSKRGRPS